MAGVFWDNITTALVLGWLVELVLSLVGNGRMGKQGESICFMRSRGTAKHPTRQCNIGKRRSFSLEKLIAPLPFPQIPTSFFALHTGVLEHRSSTCVSLTTHAWCVTQRHSQSCCGATTHGRTLRLLDDKTTVMFLLVSSKVQPSRSEKAAQGLGEQSLYSSQG